MFKEKDSEMLVLQMTDGLTDDIASDDIGSFSITKKITRKPYKVNYYDIP